MTTAGPHGPAVARPGTSSAGVAAYRGDVIVTLGDLVEDIVVELAGPVNLASDTFARITRRRGGSAANVAARAVELGAAARFVGQVGTDAIGAAMIDELGRVGVDVSCVRRSGATGTIVVLVDADGERTMLVDAGSARRLTDPGPSWLDGADALHLTLYSLVDEPIATTARAVVEMAHALDVPVSIDVSSVAVIESVGVADVLGLIRGLRPALVLANTDEASILGLVGAIGGSLVIVKHGPRPCVVHAPGSDPVTVAALPLAHAVDTTGAGDAFAAGVLSYPAWRADPAGACAAGHRAAHSLLANRAPTSGPGAEPAPS